MTKVDRIFERYRATREPKLLGRVFDRTAGELVRLAVHLTGDATEAEDLVQATFLSVMENPTRHHAGQPVMPWLLGILANHARMSRRRAARRIPEHAIPNRDTESASDTASTRELQSILRERLDELEDPYRAVLVLHLDHGLSSKEIAHALNRPRGTVRSQLHRGLDQLRRALPAGAALAIGSHLSAAAARLPSMRASILSHATTQYVPAVVAVAAMKKTLSVAAVVCVAVLAWGVQTWSSTDDDHVGTNAISPAAASGDFETAGTATADLSNERTDVVARTQPDPHATASSNLTVRVTREGGTPARGITVGIEPRSPDGWAQRAFARTDARGVVRFADLAPGVLSVTCQRGGERSVTIEFGRDATTEITLPGALSIRGKVRDRNGQPVPNAILAVGPNSHDVRSIGLANLDGGFVLDDVKAGHWIAAFSETHEPSAPRLLDASEDEIVLVLGDPGSIVEGTVRDHEGQPVEGAAVFAGWAIDLRMLTGPDVPAAHRTVTDRHGRFVLRGIATGKEMPFWAGARGHAPHSRKIRAIAGQRTRIDVQLERGCELSGTVLDESGTPSSHAMVEVRDRYSPDKGIVFVGPDWGQSVAHCNDAGEYAFTMLVPGSIRVRAGVPGEKDVATTDLDATAGAQLEWHAVLRAGDTIDGTLADSAGRALSGWRVSADEPPGAPRTGSVETDESGAFSIDRCIDDDYSIKVFAPGPWGQAVLRQAGIRPGEDLRIVVPDTAMPSCGFRGRIVDTGGAPLPGVTVVAFTRWEGNAYLPPTDADGKFEVQGLPALPMRLVAMHDQLGYLGLGSHDLRPGASVDLGTISYPEFGTVRVILRDATGASMKQATIQVWQEGWQYGRNIEIRDGVGELALPPGEYTFSFFSDHETLPYRPFGIRSGESQTLELTTCAGVPQKLRYEAERLTRGTEFIATWRDADGQLLRRNPFRLWQPKAIEIEERLVPGTYELEMRAPDGAAQTTRFTVTESTADTPVSIAIPEGAR